MNRIAFYDDNLIHLLMDDNFPVGGATVQARAWIKGFIDAGWEVSLITVKKKSFGKLKESKNIKVIYSYDADKGIRVFRWIYYRIPLLFYAIWKSKADFVYHGIPSNISGILVLICKILHKSLILRISNDILTDEKIRNKFGYFWRLLYSFGLRFSTMIICQNNNQYSNLRKRLNHKPITIITNPFLSYNIPPSSRKNGYIGWVGVFQYQKNMPLLFELAKAFPEFSFKVAGKALQNLDKITSNALIELKKLQNVQFLGYLSQEEVRVFLGQAQLLLITSLYEGFSNIILESLSVATPILLRENIDPDAIIKKNDFGCVAEKDEDFFKLLPLAMHRNFEMMPRSTDFIIRDHSPQKKIKEFSDFLKNNNL